MCTRLCAAERCAALQAHQALSSSAGAEEPLAELHVQFAADYRTHDFRRGHAEDLRRAGGRLGGILKAGDWCSAAFMAYQNKERLERDRVAEAHGSFSELDDDA